MKNYKNFLNESGSISAENIFRTKVESTSIWNIDDYLKSEGNGDNPLQTTVTWRVEPDFRADRIKAMDISVIKIESYIEWDNEEGQSGEIHFDTSLPEFKDWEIVSDIDFDKYGGVCPNSVGINFKLKQVEVD